jgi:hypothetical protein
MERAALDRLTGQLGQLVRERFPGAPVDRVAVLQYGDEPAIEPGELLARVYIKAQGAGDDRGQVLEEFHHAHRAAIRELRRDLDRDRQVGLLEFVAGGDEGSGEELGPRMRLGLRGPAAAALTGSEGQLVPVMARLGPADLETVDTLITAGIAANRADAVRWALARIRERPAYEKLRERAREIEELKAQF